MLRLAPKSALEHLIGSISEMPNVGFGPILPQRNGVARRRKSLPTRFQVTSDASPYRESGK